jgi:drug/metabolite transporter (DMT)-like permease
LQKSTTAIDEPAPVRAPAARARHSPRDYLLLLALACAWSSTYPLTKIGLESIPPITFIVARSLIAALLLLVILWLRGLRLPTELKAWKLFAFQQIINSTFPFLIITWAQRRLLPRRSKLDAFRACPRARHMLGRLTYALARYA